jgi:AcrR family transcriptional regulator
MAQKKKAHQSPKRETAAQDHDRAHLHAAALRLAAAHGWTDLSLGEIYAEAGVAMPRDVLNRRGGTWPLLSEILSSLEAAVNADVESRLGDSWRDNLFELLMTRFDQMQGDRLAYADIMPAALTRAHQAGPYLSPRLVQAMDRAIDLAGVPVAGLARPVAVAVLTGIYLSLLETWRHDDSVDLARTMAAVDKRLGWFETVVEKLSRGQA